MKTLFLVKVTVKEVFQIELVDWGIGFDNILLMHIAIFLAIEMTAMLVGESALPKQVAAIRKAPEGSGGVERVIHLRTMHACLR